MLQVVFFAAGDGTLLGVEASGHAQSDRFGRDLVCAAASALMQSLWLGLTEVLGLRIEGGWRQGELHVRLGTDVACRSEVQALMKTLQRSIEVLVVEYPRNLRMSIQRLQG